MLIRGLPEGSRTRTGFPTEWLVEHEMLASLVEVIANRGLAKSKRVHIPRPKAARKPAATKEAAVAAAMGRMRAIAHMSGGD